MPPVEVSRWRDGELMINNGVTRATRIAKLSSGTTIRVEVIDTLPIRGRCISDHWRPVAMNITTTDELTTAIAELRELFPDWRMGQLIANLATAAGRAEPGDIWDIEDEELLSAARRLIEGNRGRSG
jgi:hypothetical protein